MKYTFSWFVLPLIACLAGISSVWAQPLSSNVDAEITLQDPPSSCSFTLEKSLEYGTAAKPASGNGSVTISAVNGARSSLRAITSGNSSVGQIRLSGSNVSSYNVSRTFPSTLTRSGGSLSFDGSWAQSGNSSSGYAAITASSYEGSSRGAGSTFNRYFRFGGEVSAISLNKPNGTYNGTISASATCN